MPKCLIRGHDHELTLHHVMTQKGTGTKCLVYECPTGAYRFWSIDDRPVDRALMFKRPRWGWSKTPDTELTEAKLMAADMLIQIKGWKDG